MIDSVDRPMQGGRTDVFILGTGIKGIRHLTVEAIDAVRASKAVFTVDHGFGVLPYLRTLGPNVIDLIPEYREGRHRVLTYQRMAARVIEGALSNPPVSFATYGHPNWLVFPSELIREAGRALGLRVTTLAGISCVDTIITELGIDPAAHGLQIFEASGLVIGKVPIQPMIPCILLQVDAFKTEIFTTNRISQERLELLKDYLLQFYPGEHDCLSIYSSVHPLMVPIITKFKLAELPQSCRADTVSGSLYIPPLPAPATLT